MMNYVSSGSWVAGMVFAFALVSTLAVLLHNNGSRQPPGVDCPAHVWQELGYTVDDIASGELYAQFVTAIAEKYAEHGCERETQSEADARTGWRPMAITPFTLLGALFGLAFALASAEILRRWASEATDDSAETEHAGKSV